MPMKPFWMVRELGSSLETHIDELSTVATKLLGRGFTFENMHYDRAARRLSIRSKIFQDELEFVKRHSGMAMDGQPITTTEPVSYHEIRELYGELFNRCWFPTVTSYAWLSSWTCGPFDLQIWNLQQANSPAYILRDRGELIFTRCVNNMISAPNEEYASFDYAFRLLLVISQTYNPEGYSPLEKRWNECRRDTLERCVLSWNPGRASEPVIEHRSRELRKVIIKKE